MLWESLILEKEKNGAHLRHSEGKVIQRSRTRKVCQMAKGVTQSPAKYKAEHKGGRKNIAAVYQANMKMLKS